MPSIPQLVHELLDPDENVAYAALKALLAESERSPDAYPYWDEYVALLDHPSAYARMRAFALLSANARWDAAHRLDDALDAYLRHITDAKPIAARKCVQSLAQVAQARPDLAPRIRRALETADLSGYRDSMQPLIARDITNALNAM